MVGAQFPTVKVTPSLNSEKELLNLRSVCTVNSDVWKRMLVWIAKWHGVKGAGYEIYARADLYYTITKHK